MSDTILKIIATDPGHVPNASTQKAVNALLQSLVQADDIELLTTDTIEFVDGGENFGTIACNLCGKLIASEEWQETMDAAYATQFEDLQFVTPCCSSAASLNNLLYEYPLGFARFQIAIRNPVDSNTDELVDRLQSVLNMPLRVIWAHI
jgi:hypothetical protein